jgi:ABC-type molybdenum transport system ATPase subunit/photorepair protein PhrA
MAVFPYLSRRVGLELCARYSVHRARVRNRIASRCSSSAVRDQEREITPLFHFESAVLQYPQETNDSIDLDLGLDADSTQLDQDLLLEIESNLQNADSSNLHRLQQHWNQQSFAYSSSSLEPFNLQIYPNTECATGGGGHILMGKNGTGKSLISQSLIQNIDKTNDMNQNPYLQSGRLHMYNQTKERNRNQQSVSHVSFESHSNLLRNPLTTTVHRALIPLGGNRLSPTAKFLVVRLGIYPMLPRMVNTLSTGEIRRVLLVRALVLKPELLLLDNAFDGLDIPGRQGVHDIVERVLKGFRMDILVQGVGEARDTARTQILLATHRPEEISGGMGRVTFLDGKRMGTEWRWGRSGENLVNCLHFWESADSEEEYEDFVRSLADTKGDHKDVSTNTFTWDACLEHNRPGRMEINNFWQSGKSKCLDHSEILVEANELKVVRDDTIILSDLDWTIQRGERWHLAGTNGGKLIRCTV